MANSDIDPDDFDEELEEEAEEEEEDEIDEEELEEADELVTKHLEDRYEPHFQDLQRVFHQTQILHGALLEKLDYWVESDLGTINLLIEQGHFEALRVITPPAIARIQHILGKKGDQEYFAPENKEDFSSMYSNVKDPEEDQGL